MEHNKPTLTDEVTLTLRGLCHKRAICIWRVLENTEKQGHDPAYLWQSLREYGYDTAANIEKAMKDPSDLTEFAQHFGVGLDRNIYEMETVEANDRRFELKFHYCPFVEKWRMLGVPEEELGLITNKFYRGKTAKNRKVEGSGLGLYIAKMLMEKMDGELIPESKGEGLKIILLIPLS